MKRISLFILAALLNFSSGCSTLEFETPPAPPLIYEFTPAGFTIDKAGTLLFHRAHMIENFQAEINIRFSHDAGDGAARAADAVLAYHAPDRLYVRAYNKYIPQLFTLIVRGEQFWFYVPKENLAITGTREALMKSKDIRIEINGFDLLAAFFSAMPARIESDGALDKDGLYVLRDYDKHGDETKLLRTLWLDPATLDLARELIYTSEGLQYLEIDRRQFFAENGWRLPKFISLSRLMEEKTMVVLIWNAKINTPVSESLFIFHPPDGVQIERLKLPPPAA